MIVTPVSGFAAFSSSSWSSERCSAGRPRPCGGAPLLKLVVVSHEHKRAGLFGPGEVPGLVMPEGYKRSIAAWFARLNGHAAP